MRPNSRQLASRDMALACFTGAIDGSDFGAEFGDDDYGFDFGTDAVATPAPTPQAMAEAWQKMVASKQRTGSRAQLLEPNKGSAIKVERYAFYLNATIELDTASQISTDGNPDVVIRPQRVTMNAPAPGFITVQDLKLANVSTIVGGVADAWDFNANGVGQSMDLPTLNPQNRAKFTGAYSGFVPPGYSGGKAYLFVVGLKGPASVIA